MKNTILSLAFGNSAIVSLGFVLFFAVIACFALAVWRFYRRRRAWIPEIAKEAGLRYDENRRIYYYDKDAWQRPFGYCTLYDEAAPGLGMILDCEPVCFTWDGRAWLIEFWKGQYGAAAGAEVGIYSTRRTDGESEDPDLIFYENTEIELPVSFELYYDRRFEFRRQDRTWWLTGFALGAFARPEELTVKIHIDLEDRSMADAFEQALRQLGYDDWDYARNGTELTVLFDRPRGAQPAARSGMAAEVQARNKTSAAAARKLLERLSPEEDKLKTLKEKEPETYEIILQGLRPEKGYEAYRKLRHRGSSDSD